MAALVVCAVAWVVRRGPPVADDRAVAPPERVRRAPSSSTRTSCRGRATTSGPPRDLAAGHDRDHRHARRADARAAAVGARDRARPDRDGGDRRHGDASPRCGRCALPFGIAGLWWQHHWGLGPFDVADVAGRAALLARGERRVRAGDDRAARRARVALPALLVDPRRRRASSASCCCCRSSRAGSRPPARSRSRDPAVAADIRADRAHRGRRPAGARAEGERLDRPGERVRDRLRPLDARRDLGHAARRPLLARRDRRRRRARVRARQAPAHAQGASPGTRCSRSPRSSSSPR